MRALEILFETTVPPKPEQRHLLDAIEHANLYGEKWTLADFELKYEGYLSVDEIGNFDDLSSWVEVDDVDDLHGFRQGSWNTGPKNVPPIVVITAPDEGHCHTQIGDGRGRVNFANAHGLKLHVWHLIYKDCK